MRQKWIEWFHDDISDLRNYYMSYYQQQNRAANATNLNNRMASTATPVIEGYSNDLGNKMANCAFWSRRKKVAFFNTKFFSPLFLDMNVMYQALGSKARGVSNRKGSNGDDGIKFSPIKHGTLSLHMSQLQIVSQTRCKLSLMMMSPCC